MKAINYFSEVIDFDLKNQSVIKKWINHVVENEKKEIETINYIFCNDEYLHNLNVDYLKHDTLTDIITFDYSTDNTISGDIFISIERVKENAVLFKKSFDDELNRVIVHGILHLIGYNDKSPEDK
ncbi:MAG TPA: rRNA maturation RNase YbeY, partial [Bacteroidales bacterium]|nr:rRNA maturation RNase YbeY [Bacteroidales bacterium]